ncbi:MAG: PAS domain S-box protein, partial [Syntrophales bacterium]
YWLNTDGYFIFVNKAIIDRSGISAEKFHASHFLDLVDSDYHDQAKKNFQRVMNGEAGIHYELKYKDANGQVRTVEVYSRPIREGARIIGLLGVSRDITDRKRAEEELRESEERFRQLTDATFEGIVIHDEGKILDFNQAMLKMFGYERDEVIGKKNVIDFIAPESREIVSRHITTGYDKPYDVIMVKKDGNTLLMEVAGKTISYKGKMARVVALRDITERRHVEEVLRKSEEKYRALLENASDANLLADEHGNLIEANRNAEDLLGYPREELLQMHYTQLHPMMELEKTITAFKDIVTYGHGGLQNGAILRKDGILVPVDITATVIEYNGRKVNQASFRDITEHKRTEDTLEGLVWERTAEMSEKNRQLVEEVMERKRAEAALRKKTNELQLHSGKLEELNAALKVLLKQREEDRTELKEMVLANVKHLLVPHLEKLKKKNLDREGITIVEILETNLKNIISPFSHKLSSKYMNLTPSEIKIANLIREGKSTKEIAQFMSVSANAVNHHRHHIREKLGILSQKINLRSYLSTLS